MTSKYKAILCPYCATENLVPGNGQYVCNGCGNNFDVDISSVQAARQEMEFICQRCGTKNLVFENGRYVCNECQELFDVDCFSIPALKQPDNDSCGWATTLWLLRSFGIDVDPKRLRRELNTDAKRGFRATLNENILEPLSELLGTDLKIGKGTLPMPIIRALDKGGLDIKNPIRLESPTAYREYLDETFEEGGRAILLMNLEHWVGAERHNGRIRIMDPWTGTYKTLNKAVSEYGNFIAIGVVRQ